MIEHEKTLVSSFGQSHEAAPPHLHYPGLPPEKASLDLAPEVFRNGLISMEVKAGEETMRIYERKHSQSRHGLKTGDKIGVEVEELRSRILVAIRNSE
ncbi:hypothetical protein L3X38_028797 [Prunus dulcis]|uniref:Uncharacterized protein n=1 Tax=Prunus dulcis TaxID=3755 RepID=A0AAD4VQB8_PRUDU|nr:hypothetical protein L3X38_028797 [Prunus dulcis]